MEQPARSSTEDRGLRKLLTWTAIALVAALAMAAIAVALVTNWFDTAR